MLSEMYGHGVVHIFLRILEKSEPSVWSKLFLQQKHPYPRIWSDNLSFWPYEIDGITHIKRDAIFWIEQLFDSRDKNVFKLILLWKPCLSDETC